MHFGSKQGTSDAAAYSVRTHLVRMVLLMQKQQQACTEKSPMMNSAVPPVFPCFNTQNDKPQTQ